MIEFEMIAGLAELVANGVSIVTSTIDLVENLTHDVVCSVEVSNATKYTLMPVDCYINHGEIKVPPRPIAPKKKEALVGCKIFGVAGTSGVTAWKIGNSNVYLLVLWSAPYDFDLSANYLSIGFKSSKSGLIVDQNLFDEMYDKEDVWFNRQQFYSHVKPIQVKEISGHFMAQGSMATSHKCVAEVFLLPQKSDDMEPTLKAALSDPQ